MNTELFIEKLADLDGMADDAVVEIGYGAWAGSLELARKRVDEFHRRGWGHVVIHEVTAA